MDESGKFKDCLVEDTKGMLSLYEASYLSTSGESILDEAREFATKHLQEQITMMMIDSELSDVVSHALELPVHWRITRLEARSFIRAYEKQKDMNPVLLELAILDFNMVQTTHQKDLNYLSRYICKKVNK